MSQAIAYKQQFLVLLPALILAGLGNGLRVGILWMIALAAIGGMLGALAEIVFIERRSIRRREVLFIAAVIVLIALLQSYVPFRLGVQ